MKTLQERFSSIRIQTEKICAYLKLEDHIAQPDFFISPPKWQLGHTTWFFEDFVLKPNKRDYHEFHPDYSYMFNSYYNFVGDRVLRADRGNMTRPLLHDVQAYRKHVDLAMNDFLSELDPSSSLNKVIELGLNHEQQHQELLFSDLKYILGNNPLFPVYKEGKALSANMNSETGFLIIPEGLYEIGYKGNGFCFDNELNRHKVFVPSYEISKALVTNGEFLDFINDEGYQRFDLWLDEAWSWVKNEAIQAPLYWHKIDGVWHRYTLAGLQIINPDEQLCHVNFYEATAFAEWANKRLPTEFEWEVASNKIDWGNRWEWTYSAYLPYPGYKKAEGAIGEYNGKFMMNQMVLRGASVATSKNHSRTSYRNFFHPDARWQFSGIRLAKK